MSRRGPFAAALWASPFRPFYLAGAIYGPLVMLAWAGDWIEGGGADFARLAHGHEMLFGFAAAIIVGIVLTALPSWAGTAEIVGGRLALLAATWLAGRLAIALAPWLPPVLTAALDVALFPLVAGLVTPQLLRAANPLYLLLLPVLAGLAAGNALFHWGLADSDAARAALGLRLAVWSIVLLYALKGGVLTPIFSGNALRARGRGGDIPFVMRLDVAAVAAVALLAGLDLLGAEDGLTGAAAAAAAVLHGWRLARWRGWRLIDVPLVLVMHLGYAWMVLAFALIAAAHFGAAVAAAAWLHAFTVGSLGLMMLGLMTRVALRHTGRALVADGAVVAAYGLVFVAALLRLAAGSAGAEPRLLGASAILWASAFLVWLVQFGWMLWRPSRPREGRLQSLRE